MTGSVSRESKKIGVVRHEDSTLLRSKAKVHFVELAQQAGVNGGGHIDAVPTQSLRDDGIDLFVEVEANPVGQAGSAQGRKLATQR